MRSAFAVFLRGFVLPFGSTGRRIEFDGLLGEIRVYDSSSTLRMTIAPAGNPDQITFHTGRSGEVGPARINAFGLASSGSAAERMGVEIASGDIVGTPRDRSFIDLYSDRRDGTGQPEIHLYSDNNRVRVLVNARDIPLGVITTPFYSQVNGAAAAAGANTDMSVGPVDLKAGRLYRFTLNSTGNLSVSPGTYALDVHDGTAVVGRLWRKANAAGQEHPSVQCDYRPATDRSSVTFTVQNSGGSSGSFTPVATTTRPRSFVLTDEGDGT